METQVHTLRHKDEVVSVIVLHILEGSVAEIHQQVFKWNVNVLILFKEWFYEMKRTLKKEFGVCKIVTASDKILDNKFKRYLEMFGFSTTIVEKDGKPYIYAETEVF